MVATVFSMNKITTKRGDQGVTDLFGALRVPKHHYLIQIIGALDELQTVIGLFKVKIKNRKLLAELVAIQTNLYQLMSFLANPKAKEFKIGPLLQLVEQQLIAYQKQIKINHSFVLPGKNEAEAWAHYCRTKIRSTERLFCQHATKSAKIKTLLPFFNRLSDYFFVISQYLLKK